MGGGGTGSISFHGRLRVLPMLRNSARTARSVALKMLQPLDPFHCSFCVYGLAKMPYLPFTATGNRRTTIYPCLAQSSSKAINVNRKLPLDCGGFSQGCKIIETMLEVMLAVKLTRRLVK